MDFLEKCTELIEYIGNALANIVDFLMNLPTLLPNLIELLPFPLQDILGVFLGFFIVVILANFVKMIFVK